jgi:hypothetical protein
LQSDDVATDCPLAALRIEEGLGIKPVHPIVLLWRSYGLAEPGEPAGRPTPLTPPTPPSPPSPPRRAAV